MKSRLVFLLLAVQAGSALAQYKCTAANGAVTFQQGPCAGVATQDKLVVVPNGHPSGAAPAAPPRAAVAPPAAAAPPSADQRMLANYRNQDERDRLVEALRAARNDADARQRQRDADIAAARAQYPDEPDHQRLADALAAIDERYRALSVIDESQVREVQDAIDNWDRAQAARNAAQ